MGWRRGGGGGVERTAGQHDTDVPGKGRGEGVGLCGWGGVMGVDENVMVLVVVMMGDHGGFDTPVSPSDGCNSAVLII